ncbi:PREDICTED: uncharacterized protein LOC107170801 [Diuraphis noxia]|uniref:uncharacterized protein LOC107170801 n=1 Tax=Diuraphis noxia TaxID=143948 RepID=UPI00076384AE|nr:PREDICTED: uncharacterized protein LOC107170801 [Diuraphis noxia]
MAQSVPDGNEVEISSEDENAALPLNPVQQIPLNEENIDYDQNEHVNEIENSDSNDSVFSFVLRPGRRGAVVSNEPIVNEEPPNRAINENPEPEEHNWDERDFFVPEDLALEMWQEVYGRDEPLLDIPYVQVNRNYQEGVLNNEVVCVVCKDSLRTHAIIPCGHKVLCEECVNQLLDKRCPICNTAMWLFASGNSSFLICYF